MSQEKIPNLSKISDVLKSRRNILEDILPKVADPASSDYLELAVRSITHAMLLVNKANKKLMAQVDEPNEVEVDGFAYLDIHAYLAFIEALRKDDENHPKLLEEFQRRFNANYKLNEHSLTPAECLSARAMAATPYGHYWKPLTDAEFREKLLLVARFADEADEDTARYFLGKLTDTGIVNVFDKDDWVSVVDSIAENKFTIDRRL